MAENHGVSKGEYEALAGFRYALRKFLHFSEQAARQAGLTPQQHQALLAIMGYPGADRISIHQLAERLQLRHHSVVGLVDRLAGLGLVERSASAEDRRLVFVSLTPQGKAILDQLVDAHKEELRRLSAGLIELLAEIQPSEETSNSEKDWQ